jgi:galactose mutarotase-like enzyme
MSLTTISSDQLTVTVSDLGAEPQSILANGHEILWHGDAEWWTGRAPVLFPIVGRSVEGQVAVDGQGGEMGQHGFARRSQFERVSQTETEVVHRLISSDATRAAYPSDFELELTHRVEGPTLSVTAIVTNTSDTDMPFGLGFHPAFLWPLPGAEGQPHQITLDNGASPEVALLDGGYLTEAREPSVFTDGVLDLSHDLFDRDALIFPEGAGSGLRYHAPGAPVLDFKFENLPNLGIWQKPGAPFLCIEPWHGMAALKGAGPEIAERPYSQTLPAGQTARFAWSVTLR